MNKFKILNDIGKLIALGGIVISYESWFSGKINAESLNQKLESKFNDIHGHLNEVRKELTGLDANTASLAKSKIDELRTHMKTLSDKHYKFMENFEKGNIESESINSYINFEVFKTEREEFILTHSKILNELKKIVENDSKFLDDFSINDLIVGFKAYLAGLDTYQLCLVINITSSVFILTCIFSILMAVIGNYIINLLSLEQRFPKLAKLIQLRVKFQNYYIIFNSIIIMVAVFGLLFVNSVTLFGG